MDKTAERGQYGESLARIVYFGYVETAGSTKRQREIEVVRVVREGGQQVSQTGTGRLFRKDSEAAAYVLRLNILPPAQRERVAEWTPTGYIFAGA